MCRLHIYDFRKSRRGVQMLLGEQWELLFLHQWFSVEWNEARQLCARRNSTLPIITDEDIDSVFQQFIVHDSYSVIQNTSVWIDAHARPVNNSVSWHWIDRRPSGNDNTVVWWTLHHRIWLHYYLCMLAFSELLNFDGVNDWMAFEFNRSYQ